MLLTDVKFVTGLRDLEDVNWDELQENSFKNVHEELQQEYNQKSGKELTEAAVKSCVGNIKKDLMIIQKYKTIHDSKDVLSKLTGLMGDFDEWLNSLGAHSGYKLENIQLNVGLDANGTILIFTAGVSTGITLNITPTNQPQ